MIEKNPITSFLIQELKSLEIAAVKPSRRVLVVDDSMDYATMIRDVLTEEGCDVEIVTEPESAVSSAKAAVPFSRVFMDLNFPGKENGLQAFKKIRAFLPTVPITIVSGFVDEEFSEAAKQFGFDVLKKRDGIDALREVIRNTI